MKILVTLAVLCLGLLISAQVLANGKCPHVNVQKEFDQIQYCGTWYEIAKFYTSFEAGLSCVRAIYSPTGTDHFEVYNEGIDYQNRTIWVTGDAYPPDPTVLSKIKVRFGIDAPYLDYWILDTDFVTYSLVYSCINVVETSHLEFAWILSRKPSLDDNIRRKLYNELELYGINITKFIDTDQSFCTNYL